MTFSNTYLQFLTDDLETVSYIKDGRGVLEAGVRVEYDVEKFNMKETAETRTMIEQLWAERTRSNARNFVPQIGPSVKLYNHREGPY